MAPALRLELRPTLLESGMLPLHQADIIGALSGIWTHVGGRPNGFQDCLVMTTSILPHSENPLGAESREGIIGDDKTANGAQEPEKYITRAIEPTEIRRRAF